MDDSAMHSSGNEVFHAPDAGFGGGGSVCTGGDANGNASVSTGVSTGVRTGASAEVSGGPGGALDGSGGVVTAKVKQVKAKVTERVKKNDKGEVVSRCWDVQVGSGLVRVYLTPHGERQLCTVSYWLDGRRKRQVFSSLEKAIAEAKTAATSLNRGDLGSAELSATERVACKRAMQLLEPTGVPIEAAAADYALLMAKAGSRARLFAAVEDFVKRDAIGIKPMRVEEVVTECLKSKREDRLSDRYLKQLEYDLKRFKAKFRNYIGDVAGRDIDAWLRELGVSGRTRNNIRMSVQTLMGFAKGRRYLPKDHDEMDAVPLAKEEEGAIEIFTPAEMRELLLAASEEMVPFLAIGGFAGVRHAEIQRLDWQHVRFDAGIIEIHAGNAKTATRRTIPILPNLRAWLKPHAKESGPVCPFANATDQIVGLVTKINQQRSEARGQRSGGEKQKPTAGLQDDGATGEKGDQAAEFKWKHNGLRHSFISYRVATVKDVPQVSLEAGNSPQMIFNNYRELVTPQDAKEWFRIRPAGVEKHKAQSRKQKSKQERQAKIVAFPAKVAA